MRRVAAASLAILLLGGARGCCSCVTNYHFERRDGDALSPGAAVTLTPPTVRLLHFGDFGSATCQQSVVASAMADANARKPFDLAIHIGDNLYDCGPDWRSTAAAGCNFNADGNTVVAGYTPPDDPSFREKFEDALSPLADAGVPIYVGLGNHDVVTSTSCVPVGDPVAIGRAKACLEVAHSSTAWTMPARHYVVDQGPARFIVVDSNLVEADYGGFDLQQEVDFLTSATIGCDTRPCFLFAHHPAAAAGEHAAGFTADFTARTNTLLAAAGGKLRAMLSGHDHDLQHLRTPDGLDVFISGNGCRDRPSERFADVEPAGATLLYGTVRWGFATLEVSSTAFTWRLEDEQGVAIYCCAATLAGTWSQCNPVACE